MIKDSLGKIVKEVLSCKKCRLSQTRIKAVAGEGPLDTICVVIGESPGAKEDKEGKPFIGVGGKFLNKLLKEAKIRRESLYITSVIKCHPPNNRKPKKDEIRACLPFLKRQLKIIKPKIVILLGEVALNNVLTNKKKLKDIHGKIISREGIIFIPTYHPNAALRFPSLRKKAEKDFKIISQQLKRFSAKKNT